MDDIQKILNTVISQEDNLIIKAPTLDNLVDIGKDIVRRIKEKNATGTVIVNVDGTIIYEETINGASPDNRSWAIRKGNVVNLLWKSSYRVTLQSMIIKKDMLASRGLSISDYAISGGAFPIKIDKNLTIGYFGVSGMTQEEDHQVVVDAISSFIEYSK